MFISNPYLPERDVRLCLVDQSIGKTKSETLKARKIECLASFCHTDLMAGISSHPDMTICPLGEEYFISAPEAHAYYQELLRPYGLQVLKGETSLQIRYPYDIAYNVLLLNKMLFGNLQYVDARLLQFAEKAGYQLIHTNQGYMKCSVYPISHDAVLTQDAGVCKLLKNAGLDVLLISGEGICLKHFPNGFIGGTGGKIGRGRAAFFGDIKSHREYDKIERFLQKYGVIPVDLSHEPLEDHGSLLPLLTL